MAEYTKAKLITQRYEAAKEDARVRTAKSLARREHYENTGSKMPFSKDYVLTSASASTSQRHELRVNRAHETAVKLVGRFLGECPQSRVVPRQNTESERWRSEACERMLAGVYADSQAEVQFQSTGWHGSVLGAGVVQVGFAIGRNMPWFKSVRPEHVFVKLATGDGSEWEYAVYAAERTAASVAKKYKVDIEGLTVDRYDELHNQRYVNVLDYWDDDEHLIVAGGLVLKEEVNRYGWIPYIIFRNTGPTEYVWGLSDQEFFEALCEYYNTLISQHADVIHLYSNPPIFAKGTGLEANTILDVFRRGGVIATNKEHADVRVVTASGAPPEYGAQDTRIRELIQEMTFAGPEGATLSGTAVAEMRAAQDALMALKRANWTAGQQLLNQRIFEMIEKFGTGKMKFGGVTQDGLSSRSFYMELDDSTDLVPEEDILAEADQDPTTIGMTRKQILESRCPQDTNYKRLIDKHYKTRIIWNNRSAKQDPQYQLMNLNFFSQGAMSLRTLLEEKGVEDVEREIDRVKRENEEMPWLRPQVAAAQAATAQGFAGSGAQSPVQQGGMAPQQGDPFNMAARGLNGSERTSQGVGAVMGAPNGGQ